MAAREVAAATAVENVLEGAEESAWPVPGLRPNRLRTVEAPAVRHRVLCFGGGTGLPVVLRGLAARGSKVDLTAVVAMSDDGGSSGRLRRSLGLLPPGDIRNCLVAMARRPSPLADLFQYRFDGGRHLAGHAVGNLLLAALAEQEGDFLQAVKLASQLLGVRGKVLPSTLESVELVAELEGDMRLVGERHLASHHGRVRRVALLPRDPAPVDGLLEAIASADLIVYGPGSLYSSLLPNLLVGGVAQALRETRARRVLVSNLMTQPGETEAMDGVAHVQAIHDHVGPVVDVVLANVTAPPPEVLERYAHRRAQPVAVDAARLAELGVSVAHADLLKEGRKIRHDRRKLAHALLGLSKVSAAPSVGTHLGPSL